MFEFFSGAFRLRFFFAKTPTPLLIADQNAIHTGIRLKRGFSFSVYSCTGLAKMKNAVSLWVQLKSSGTRSPARYGERGKA
jgi:hypothetical protein